MMVYGAFILVGGVMGAAVSVIALVMGVDLWWSGHCVWLGFAWSTEVGFLSGCGGVIVINAVFGARFVQTGAVFPALLRLIFSRVAFIVLMYMRGRNVGRLLG
jgi:hypothetical protein